MLCCHIYINNPRKKQYIRRNGGAQGWGRSRDNLQAHSPAQGSDCTVVTSWEPALRSSKPSALQNLPSLISQSLLHPSPGTASKAAHGPCSTKGENGAQGSKGMQAARSSSPKPQAHTSLNIPFPSLAPRGLHSQNPALPRRLVTHAWKHPAPGPSQAWDPKEIKYIYFLQDKTHLTHRSPRRL